MFSTKKLIMMAKKWQKLAAASRKRISMSRSNMGKRAPTLEKGHFVVYTTDAKRFTLPLAYLESEIFRELLKMAEEEFGLSGDGPITLPCDSVLFEYAASIIQQHVQKELTEALLLSISHFRSSPSDYHYEQLPISCC